MADGIELDYSARSLAHVDAIVEGFRSRGLTPRDIGGTLVNIGFYLGEVLVRHTRAEWISSAGIEQQEYATCPVVLRWPDSGRIANPFARVFRRFEEGPVEDFGFYYDSFAESN